MSREVRRVPLDFNWPLNRVWAGYVRPEPRPCPGDCESGWTVAGQWLNAITHLLLMVSNEAVRDDRPLHPWLAGLPLGPGRKPRADAAALGTGLAGRGPRFSGHDAIDRHEARRKIVAAAGLDPDTWGTCPVCDGDGYHPGDYDAVEGFEPTDPPTGKGWQLWETVSEGSPISPVFPTADALVEWMVTDYRGPLGASYTREEAHAFVAAGSSRGLSFVTLADGRQVDGVALAARDDPPPAPEGNHPPPTR